MMIVGKHLCLMQFEAFGQIMPLSLQKTGVTWESKGTQETTLSPPAPGVRVAYGCIRPYSRTTVVNNFYSTLKSCLGRHIAVHPVICHTVNIDICRGMLHRYAAYASPLRICDNSYRNLEIKNDNWNCDFDVWKREQPIAAKTKSNHAEQATFNSKQNLMFLWILLRRHLLMATWLLMRILWNIMNIIILKKLVRCCRSGWRYNAVADCACCGPWG